MVNVGHASKGCRTCISRKIRCDQQRPICGQCTKSHRQCLGYRNETETNFIDQSHQVVARAQAEQSRSSSNSTSRAAQTTIPFRTRSQTSNDNPALDVTAAIPRSPKLIEDSSLQQFFINNFACPNLVTTRSSLFWIPPSFDTLLARDKRVRLCAESVGAIAVAHLHRSADYTIEAHRRYGLALQSISDSWQADLPPADRACLMAILFLSFYEVLASNENTSREAWRAHLGGLKSLLARKSQGDFARTEFGSRMFWQTRGQVIMNALQTRTAVNMMFEAPRVISSESPELAHLDQSGRLMIRVANIQAKCQASTFSDELAALIDLEEDLKLWMESTPASYSYSKQFSLNPSNLWWDARRDVYASGFVAFAWNQVRGGRILVHGLIQTILLSLPQATDASCYAGYRNSSIIFNPLIHNLVQEVCGSIPLYYRPGYDHAWQANPPPLGTIFWFLWSLEVVGSIVGAPPELANWMADVLQRMYDTTGNVKAQKVADRLRTGDTSALSP